MPSNHAVNAFAAAAIFSHFFRKSAIPMFLIAILVAFSRIYVGVHYPSDVIAGAVWGGVVAGAVLILHKWSSERFKEKPHTTILFISLLALTLFRYYYILTGPVDLSPDEALKKDDLAKEYGALHGKRIEAFAHFKELGGVS